MNDNFIMKEAKQKIEQAEKGVSHILHLLQTPLLTINLSAELLFKQFSTNQQEALFQLNKIIRSVKQIEQLAETMHHHIKGGVLDTNDCGYYHICHTIREAIQEYPFKSHEIRKRVIWEPLDDFVYVGSALMVKQVILDLLDNALYFVEQSEKEKWFIEFNVTTGEGYNQLSIVDSGVGIDPKYLSTIFDRYTTYHRPKAIGLGLSFCKEVMQSLGGAIFCESEQGEYTEIKLQFPG